MRNDGNSQCDEILRALKKGHRLTPDDAYKICGSRRLAARIYELKQMGYEIDRQMIDTPNARVAEYRLARQKRAAA